jgi:hypothetical protein
VTGGVIIVDVFGDTGLVANGATGPAGPTGPPGTATDQLSWAAGPLNTNLAEWMTFGDPLAVVRQVGSIVMATTGAAQCMYVQLNEAAAADGTDPGAGFEFRAFVDGVPSSLVVDITGANTGGVSCVPTNFSSGQSIAVGVSAISDITSGPQTGAFASVSISYSHP